MSCFSDKLNEWSTEDRGPCQKARAMDQAVRTSVSRQTMQETNETNKTNAVIILIFHIYLFFVYTHVEFKGQFWGAGFPFHHVSSRHWRVLRLDITVFNWDIQSAHIIDDLIRLPNYFISDIVCKPRSNWCFILTCLFTFWRASPMISIIWTNSILSCSLHFIPYK